MKRVLFVDHASRILGGAEINVLELAEAAAQQGCWETACACGVGSPLGRRWAELGLAQYDYGLGPDLNRWRVAGGKSGGGRWLRKWSQWNAAREQLDWILKEFQPEFAISCSNKDHICASPVCRSLGIPLIWWVNDILSSDFFPWPARWMFRQAARKGPARLATVSEFARRALVDLGIPPEKVLVIPNGIPATKYHPRDKGRLRKLLEISADERVIGMLGRFAPWKGQGFFLDMAEEWVRKGRAGHFVLVGQAFNEDARFEAGLRERSISEPLVGRVSLVPFQKDVAAVLGDFDVLVHASLRPEPFGRVLIEAMAAGVPVLAANGGGVEEIVEDGVTGLLAGAGDVRGYIAGLSEILDGGKRQGLVERAKEQVQLRFGIQRVLEQFDSCLVGTVSR